MIKSHVLYRLSYALASKEAVWRQGRHCPDRRQDTMRTPSASPWFTAAQNRGVVTPAMGRVAVARAV